MADSVSGLDQVQVCAEKVISFRVKVSGFLVPGFFMIVVLLCYHSLKGSQSIDCLGQSQSI